jgi:hypothetical protein
MHIPYYCPHNHPHIRVGAGVGCYSWDKLEDLFPNQIQ